MIRLSKQEGSFLSVFKKIELVLHGFDDKVKAATVNGSKAALTSVQVRLLDPLIFLKDYYDPSHFASLRQAEPLLKQQSVIFDNDTADINIQLQ